MNESDLLDVARRVAAGDLEAFELIVHASTDRLFRLAARMLGSRTEAQDAVQESYLRAFQALQSGRWGDRSSVEGWLTRIVTNLCIDLLRARRNRPLPIASGSGGDTHEAYELLGSPSSAPDSIERALLVREQLALLDVLPAEQRAAIVLRHLEGMSNAEVAGVLQITEGAVEQRLLRARASLRKKMDDDPV